jgi:hypothetical protein
LLGVSKETCQQLILISKERWNDKSGIMTKKEKQFYIWDERDYKLNELAQSLFRRRDSIKSWHNYDEQQNNSFA